MEIRYFKNYSHCLGRDMEFKVYGHAGKPVMFVPCQAGRFFDFENFKMIDYFGPYIEAGKITVYAIDTIDNETWANANGDKRWRAEQHERWYHYLVDEMAPTINHLAYERNGHHQKIYTYGASLGALHAANLFFRRPDLFDGVLALSGIYDSYSYFGDYVDDIIYNNCPNFYLPNLPQDHHYMDLYNNSNIIICCGQGAWEHELKVSTDWLSSILHNKGINAWVDIWGPESAHDWDWWYKQVEYFLPYFIDGKAR